MATSGRAASMKDGRLPFFGFPLFLPHLSCLVGEDPHLRHLLGEPFYFGGVDVRSVGYLDAQKDHESFANFPRLDAVGHDACAADSLYHGFHCRKMSLSCSS